MALYIGLSVHTRDVRLTLKSIVSAGLMLLAYRALLIAGYVDCSACPFLSVIIDGMVIYGL